MKPGWPRINKFSGIFLCLIGGLAGCSVLFAFMLNDQARLNTANECRHRSFLLADELRQSSDDLTRFAYLYVMTGDPKFEARYWAVAAIRDGKSPRPSNYQRIYWNFVDAADSPPVFSEGRSVALLDLMKEEGFSDHEIALLSQAKANSDGLIRLETRAMNAVKGIFQDARGNYTLRSRPDLELARQLMLSKDYYSEKARIMRPIDDFLVELDRRTAADVAQCKGQIQNTFAALIAVSIVSTTVTLVLAFLLQSRVTEHARRLDLEIERLVLAQGEIQRNRDQIVDELAQRKQADQAVREANRALADANRRAEAANSAKSEFLANMSHEIRTPITAILGYAELLVEEDVGQIPREHALVIRRNGEHLLGVINDVLDLSKIEAGKLAVQCVRCSPAELLLEVVSLMRVRADAKHLQLSTDLAGPIPASMQTDPLRLRQILVNLVGNAIKFTEQGGIRITARLLSDAPKPMLQFEVSDTGIGMNEEQLAHLFRPFSQVDGSASRRFGGTGLGLVISKRLVEALGGAIDVSSTEGAGSTFCVTVDPGELDGVPWIDALPAACTAENRRDARAIPKLRARVLLAEDGIDNQRLISAVLRKAGADVTAVDNGRSAVDQALAQAATGDPFDVILMDIQMPIMDGYTATRFLRQRGYAGPIIALTANAMADDRRKCLDAGCNDYATKPIDRIALLETIAGWAEQSRSKDVPVTG